MAYNPTVVIGHLNDQELKNSINSLVAHVNEGMNKIVSSTNTAVENIKNKLKELEATSKNTNNQRSTALEKEAKAAKETTASYDNMQAAMQKATGKNNALELYDKQLLAFRNRLAEVRQDIDIYNYAIGSGKKTQIEWGQAGLKKANEEAERLMRTIAAMEAQRGNIANIIAPQGHTIQNYVNSLQRANPELRLLNEQYKTGQSLLQQRRADETAAAQSTQRYTEEIIRQAKALRESESWKRGESNILTNQGVVTLSRTIPLEEQLLQLQEMGYKIVSSTATEQQKLAENVQKTAQAMNNAAAGAKKVKENWTIPSFVPALESANALSSKLKELREQYNKLNWGQRQGKEGQAIARQIREITRALQVLSNTAARPKNMKEIIGLDESTLDNIAYKIKQLQAYKRGINIADPKNEKEIRDVDNAINRLNGDLNKYMRTTQQAMGANNALARSWNYMKNRLAFYFTVGASTQFVKNLIDVRSQYEMNERALGILIDSAERGTQIFNELSQMALVSPYTLIELSAAAKQLTAYDVAAKDVVDTTRRLADMAAAVGVPIDRLTYALGQIKAYGYLNSRDARMFANAGIPLIKQLADYYTELEGRMVSTAEVYDKIKKKAVDYNTVMNVVTKMTDDGGKFFNFQAKMADTLKVRLANLTLAWNNMLNDIGKSTQGVLTWGIGALRTLFTHWKQFDKLIKDTAWLVGIRTGFLLVGAAALRLGANFGVLNKYMTTNAIFGKKLADVLRTVWASLARLVTSPMAWAAVGAMAVYQLADAFINADRATKEFGKGLRETAKTAYEDLSKFLDSDVNISLRKDLGQSRDTGGAWSTPAPKSINEAEAKNAWETVREQIELATQNSDDYIGRLLTIEDLSERLRQGFSVLDKIREVDAVLKDVGDKAIKINQDFSAWWNLNKLPDGLIKNLRDYVEYTEEVNKETNYTAEGLENLTENSKSLSTAVVAASKDYTRFKADLTDTTNSINELIQSQTGWSTDIEKISEVYAKVTQKIIQDNQLNPADAFQLQLEMEEARTNAAKAGLMARIQDEKNALEVAENENARRAIQTNLNALNQQYADFEKNNGRGKALWESYTTWLKERHISETRAMFGDMSAEEIKKINFSEGKWKDFVMRTTAQFANDHKLAINDVFNLLHNWVQNANQWSIFIPLTISSEGGKSIIDTLNEADSQIEASIKNIERLKREQQRLMKLGGVTSADADVARKYLEVTKEIAAEEDAMQKAREKGGYSKTEEKDALKAAKEAERERKRQHRDALKQQRQEETELQKALKNQLSVIDKIRNVYSSLTEKGMTHAKAITISTRGYEKTTKAINDVLQKWGIEAFDPKKYAGISDPNDILKMLSDELNKIVNTGRANPTEIKELEVKIKELEVDAEKFNMTRIIKGLDNELDSLKDQYELSVELDANPELASVFENMFGIKTSDFPKTIDEYMDKAQDLFDELRKASDYTAEIDIFNADDKKWEKWASEVGISDKALADIRKRFDGSITMAKKWARDVISQTKSLEYELADKEGKIAIEEQKREILKQQWMQETNELQKKLLGLQLKQQEDAIQKLKDDLFELLPAYKAVFGGMAEHSVVTTKKLAKQLLGALNTAKDEGNGQFMFTDPISGETTHISGQKRASLINRTEKEIQKSKSSIEKLRDAFKKGEDGEIDYVKGIELVGQELEKLSGLINTIGDITAALGMGEEGKEAIADYAELLGGIGQAAEGYTQMRNGDIIGGAANIIKGAWSAIGAYLDNANNRINRQIETSEQRVKFLEVAYRGLQNAVEDAYGTMIIGAQKAAIANREAELYELRRQLLLENSRKSKDRDDDKIADLMGQINDLEREISNMSNQIVNDLLGISSIGDAMENLMDGFVEALRNGEDAMASFGDNIDAMIANMVKKMFTTKVLQPWFEDQWNKIQEGIDKRSADTQQMITEYQQELAKIGTGEIVGIYKDNGELETDKDKMRDMVNKRIEELQNRLVQETAVTPDDIRQYAEILRSGQPIMQENMQEIANLLRELGLIKDTAKEANLSALQQGIQGITEDTAGALEAYMNSVSQQVYLHSDLLTQIRDAVVGYDLDVQTASISQILLQLQSSYQVQMSIYNTITSVVSPSGRSFNVELIS